IYLSHGPEPTQLYTLSLHDALPILGRAANTGPYGPPERENATILTPIPGRGVPNPPTFPRRGRPMRVLLRSGISRAAAACVLGAVVSVLAIAGSGVRRDEGVQPAVPASGAHPAAPAREPGPEQAPAPISEPVPEPPLR